MALGDSFSLKLCLWWKLHDGIDVWGADLGDLLRDHVSWDGGPMRFRRRVNAVVFPKKPEKGREKNEGACIGTL